MADIANILKYLALSSLVHPWGHVQTGNDLNIPVAVNYGQGIEHWDTPDKRKNAEIAFGGFGIQNKLGQALSGSKGEPDMRIANALYKIGYLSGIKPSGIEGDVKDMQNSSGNKLTSSLLGLSVLADLWKSQNPRSNFDLNFIAPNGAPGLMGTWRW